VRTRHHLVIDRNVMKTYRARQSRLTQASQKDVRPVLLAFEHAGRFVRWQNSEWRR